MRSSIGLDSSIYGKMKNVANHQPDRVHILEVYPLVSANMGTEVNPGSNRIGTQSIAGGFSIAEFGGNHGKPH